MSVIKPLFRLALIAFGLMAVGTANGSTFSGSFDNTVPEANATGVSSTISIADAGSITNINIQVSIDHPWIGDLAMFLVAPDGTSITLLDRPGLQAGVGLGFCCGSGADLESITFSDAASLAAEDIVSSFDLNPIASPTDALSNLTGFSLAGDWTLTIADYAQGQMNTTAPSWSIIVNESVMPVPLPAALWLLLSGVSVLGAFGKTRNQVSKNALRRLLMVRW